jgi:hypothetical protein
MNRVKNILIEGTAKTPKIDFNQISGELVLSGKSIPENAAKVYEPLMNWVHDYIKSPRPITNFRLNLDYCNSRSSKWFAKIIKELSKINKDDYVLFIHRYFDIEDFYDTDKQELKDFVGSLADNIVNATVSIGVKAYGTEENGKIIKESMILI